MKKLAGIICALLAFGSLAWAAIELGGYYENDILGIIKPNGYPAPGEVNRLRLKFDLKPSPEFTVHLEPRYYFLIKVEDIPMIGITDMDHLVWDRYYAKAALPLFSLTAGKQRIAWGTGYIWNPTDVFNPYVLSFAVREEETTNVEALRVEVPFGEASGADVYTTLTSDLKHGARVKTTLGLFDLSLSYVDKGGDKKQAGFDFAGDLWEFGVRGEGVVQAGSRQTQVMLGGEYTLDNGVGLNLEYYFDGTANESLMRHLYFGANKILDELTRVSASLVYNLNDLSFLFYPSYTRSLSQNLDLMLQSMIVGGLVGTEFYPSPAQDPSGFAGSKLVMAKLVWNF